MEKEQNHFLVKKITKIQDFVDGTETKVYESDLTLQGTDHVVQFDFKSVKEPKQQIKPGVYTLVYKGDVSLKEIVLKTQDLLETAKHTKLITNEIEAFERKIDVYKRLNRPAKRSILLYSAPGLGKTSTITKIAQDRLKNVPGQVVLYWDTGAIDTSDVNRFFSTTAEFDASCSNLLFVMEDIGGGNVEGPVHQKSADSSLLELLDGASLAFPLPTFIIATTNCPERLLKSLADRPGRFDQLFELEAPDAEERIKLAKFISKRELNDDEKEALKGAKNLSIAHITEIIVRSELHDKTFGDVIKEMKEHTRRVENMFLKFTEKMGLGVD